MTKYTFFIGGNQRLKREIGEEEFISQGGWNEFKTWQEKKKLHPCFSSLRSFGRKSHNRKEDASLTHNRPNVGCALLRIVLARWGTIVCSANKTSGLPSTSEWNGRSLVPGGTGGFPINGRRKRCVLQNTFIDSNCQGKFVSLRRSPARAVWGWGKHRPANAQVQWQRAFLESRDHRL